jgi:hypothetical protein
MAEILASNVIRLLVTVAILAAVYLFAIKPILDTTNDAFDSVGGSIDRAFQPFDGIQSDIENSLDNAGIDPSKVKIDKNDKGKAQQLLNCIQKVQPDTDKMQACVKKYQG